MKRDAANGSVGLCVGDMINEGIIHHSNRRGAGIVKGVALSNRAVNHGTVSVPLRC